MRRLLLLLTLLAAAAGCKANNPAAAFGAPTVPAPKTLNAPPYYPGGGTPAQLTPAPPPASGRLSVSAEGSSPPPQARSAVRGDPAEREPIRIVENPAAATRTAAAPPRDLPPPQNKLPAATSPTRIPTGKTSPRNDAAVVPASYQQPVPAFVEPAAATGQWRAR